MADTSDGSSFEKMKIGLREWIKTIIFAVQIKSYAEVA